MLIFLYLLWTWSPHFYSSYHFFFFFFPLFSFMLCRTKAGGRRRHGSVHPSTQRGESPVAPWLSNEKQPRQLLSLCRRVSSFVYWIKKNSMLRCSLSSILWWFIKFFRFDFVLENSSDGRGLDSSFGWVETSISVAIDNKPSPYWRDGFLPDISSSPHQLEDFH